MRGRVRKAALQILLLQTEFTQSELAEAARYVSENSTDDFLELFKDTRAPEGRKKPRAVAFTDQVSPAVAALEGRDVAKYELLREVDSLVRSGQILPKLEDVRKLGERISKEFDSGKSRKEAVPKLMLELSSKPTPEIRALFQEIVQTAEDGSSEYAALASFLIHGKTDEGT